MWLGIFAPAALSGHGVAYAEISKLIRHRVELLLCEQALLSRDKAFKYARVAKFHCRLGLDLYYGVYPGVMVAVTGVFVGYVVASSFQCHERVKSARSSWR